MQPEYNLPISRATQITITNDTPETPKTLVLRLKKREGELKTEEVNLKTIREKNVYTLGRSALGNSSLLSSLEFSDREFEDLGQSLYYSIANGDVDLDEEEAAFQYLDIQEKLKIVKEEQDIVQEHIEIAGNHEQEVQQINNLQAIAEQLPLFLRHVQNIVKREGTTLLTAVVTAGAGIYTGNAAVGVGTLLIAGNEILKMASSYMKDAGANDNLLVIKNALQKIENNNILSKKSIERAEKSQEEVAKKIGEIDVVLDDLERLLVSVGEKQGQHIQNAIDKLKGCKGALVQQSHELEQSRLYLLKSINIAADHSKQFDSLLSAEYKVSSEEDLTAVIDEINFAISNLKKRADDVYNLQNQAMSYLLKAMERKNELISLHHELTSAFMQIQLLNLELGRAEEKVDKIKVKQSMLKQQVSETKEELEVLKKINKEDKIEIKIGQENLKAEISKDHFGETSIIYGGALTGGTGATIGMLLAGPTVALGLGAAAFVGLGTLGMRAVHMVRLAMRTNDLEKRKMQLEALQSAIESEKFDKNGKVKIYAEYGYSQGSYMGTRSLKGAWNAAGYALNYVAGKEVVGEYKSSHAGMVISYIGNLPIVLDFDKSTGPGVGSILGGDATNPAYEEYVKYGAVSQKDQQDLRDLLLLELKKGALTPVMILELLDKLSEVQIGNEVVAMIRKDSLFMVTLREECQAMLLIKDPENFST